MHDYTQHTLPKLIDAEIDKLLQENLEDLHTEQYREKNQEEIQQFQAALQKNFDELQEKVQEENKQTGRYKMAELTKNYNKMVEEMTELRKSLSKAKEELEKKKEKATTDKKYETATETNENMVWNIVGIFSCLMSLISIVGAHLFWSDCLLLLKLVFVVSYIFQFSIKIMNQTSLQKS